MPCRCRESRLVRAAYFNGWLNMITKEQVIPLLLEACPSFKKHWEKFDDKDLLYVALGEFARHLLQLQLLGQIETFKAVGIMIEHLHLEGDSYVQEAATIGLLEGIQNVWGNNKVESDLFKPYLLPTSRKWWDELNSFWQGERRYVGEGLVKDLPTEEIAKIRDEVRKRFNKPGESK
jgi:hypothetical protein